LLSHVLGRVDAARIRCIGGAERKRASVTPVGELGEVKFLARELPSEKSRMYNEASSQCG
jgi:hypothetical protein